jgi:hypothetical protein
MSNNYFNFRLPDFQEKYGSDWDDFIGEIDDIIDEVYSDTFDLYRLSDIDRMKNTVVNILVNVYKIATISGETSRQLRVKLRSFPSIYANKGLAIIYIEIAEGITGIAGELYTADILEGWLWDTSTFPIRFGDSDQDKFIILFDVKTTDNTELDSIQELLRDKTVKPAFYQMFLIDSSYNILRTI